MTFCALCLLLVMISVSIITLYIIPYVLFKLTSLREAKAFCDLLFAFCLLFLVDLTYNCLNLNVLAFWPKKLCSTRTGQIFHDIPTFQSGPLHLVPPSFSFVYSLLIKLISKWFFDGRNRILLWNALRVAFAQLSGSVPSFVPSLRCLCLRFLLSFISHFLTLLFTVEILAAFVLFWAVLAGYFVALLYIYFAIRGY